MSEETNLTEANEGQSENESILEKITNALENLVALEIKTIVGEMTFDDKDKAVFPSKPKAMYSKIDLLQGDITSIYDPEFITGEYTNLKEFHQDRESQGQEIIQNNIETLRDLITLIKDEGLKPEA